MPFTYPYPRPAVTVDTALFDRAAAPVRVLLILRAHEPFAGCWALPGGFVDEHESLEAAARRELEEETSVRCGPLTQVGAFGDPGRDPRGHTISIAFAGFVDGASGEAAGDDASQVAWFPLSALPPLTFDHERIIEAAKRACGL